MDIAHCQRQGRGCCRHGNLSRHFRTAATRSRSGKVGKEISCYLQQHTQSGVCTRHPDPHDPG
ncbi:MAG: hypothetical protein DRI24_16685, partial [Deltaproteobacteria bacterium]